MRGLDETDRQIVRLLLEDGRRPFSDIAEQVGLSAPAVSDRVDRLQETGLLRRFTVDLDRSMLREGVPVLVDVRARPGHGDALRDALGDAAAVEHVFVTADERLVFTATVPDADVRGLLADTIDLDAVDDYEVSMLADTDWTPRLGEAELAPECVECGNTVTTEGVTTRLDGEAYQFCCSSCEAKFVDRYEQLREGA